LNYRHAYHAGNFADVFKHIMLVLVLDHLRQKDKPFFALDSHAGIGLYDLEGAEAGKTGEAEQGIGRLREHGDVPEEVKRYLALVTKFNKGNKQRFYPGSPLIIREMLRDGDRMAAGELHPEDAAALEKNMGRDRRVKVMHEDGYRLIKAMLPPPERRGVVLCDPPFEVKNEFDLMLDGLKEGTRRWATGIYMFWYPVKDNAAVRTFHKSLKTTGIPKITAFEFMQDKTPSPGTFNGSGLAIVNPPWGLEEQARAILPWLVETVTAGRGYYKIIPIAGE
jgi:23S rRNA (adenine2030-N6)-methyltransferase